MLGYDNKRAVLSLVGFYCRSAKTPTVFDSQVIDRALFTKMSVSDWQVELDYLLEIVAGFG